MSRTQHDNVANHLDNAIANLEFVMRILAGAYGNSNWHLSQAINQADNALRNLRVQLMLQRQDEYPVSKVFHACLLSQGQLMR